MAHHPQRRVVGFDRSERAASLQSRIPALAKLTVPFLLWWAPTALPHLHFADSCSSVSINGQTAWSCLLAKIIDQTLLCAAFSMGTGRWYRPFSLRSGKASSQPRRTAHPHPSLFAKAHATCRGLYNSYLLPTVPLVDLTVGQCMVLCLYFVFVTVSTFVGARGRDLLDRSGRIA